MKKITLLLVTLFFSMVGYSQLTPTVEGFESTTGPTPLPSTTWSLSTGNWAVFDNGVGLNQRWGINSTVVTPPTPPLVYQGANSAYVNRENIGQGNTSEDYLSTPLVNIPTNGQLRFYTRTFSTGNQGTLYQIKVAPSTASQTDPAAYTLVQQWTEVDLTVNYNIYEEKLVDLSAYANQQVYVSFVKVYTQPLTVLDGDRWLIDNVSILERCLDPTNLAANGITQTSANLSWGNPSGATSWEIEVLPVAGTFTGVGVVYNGALPFNATATATGTPLAPSTDYKYYVRALCSNGSNSLWIGPFNFSTTSPGFSCAAPIVIGSVPYSTTDNTGNYGDTTDVAQPAACAGTATNYMTGNDVFYSYTPTTSGAISVTMTPTANWSGVFVYQGCANVGVSCLAGVANTGGAPRVIPSIAVTAGQEYIIVISTNAAPQTIGYTLVIQTVNCAEPTTLSVSGLTQTSANLSWANPGGATSWEVAVQTAGSPIPAGPGVQTNVNANYLVPGLTVNTAYQYYVRADCNNGTFSAWAGPFLFNTLCDAFPVPFQEGFNTGSPTENCWTVLNLNNDADAWNMNYATTPFEGNQCAAITTDFNAGANNDWLISPQIILNGNQRLKFHYRVQSTGEPNDFRVMLSQNGTSPADFTTTLIPLASYNNTTYVQRIQTLAGISGPVNIAWHIPAGGLDGWRLYIDNVIIEDIPTCPEPTLVASSGVLSTSATISWTNGGSETAWQVLALPCGSPAPTASSTGFVDVTAGPPYTLTGLTPTTCYDVYVRAVCSPTDISPWTGPATFTTQVAPPVCGGTFTDPGGPNGDYAGSTDSTVTICPVNPGDVVTVTFNLFETEANWDALYVFDGNSITAPQIASTNGAGNVPGGLPGGYWGTAIPGPFTSSSADGCLTFRFRSDTSVQDAGWVANVTCGPPPTCRRPTAVTTSTVTSNSVILNWTQPTNPDNSVASAWQVLALPCGSPAPAANATGFVDVTSGPPYTLTGLSSSTCYDIYIRAVCSSTDSSIWSGPSTITTQVAPPVCGGTFVDAGGPANYPGNSDSTVTVCPVNPGDVVTVTFTSFNTETNWDALYVFDGNSITSPQIASTNGAGNVPGGLTGGYWGSTIPGPFTSSSPDGCLTFRFRSDGAVNLAGWVANVTCNPAPECQRPNTLTATNITTTSAYLGWSEPNPAIVQWEVIILPLGSPVPSPSATGTIVSTNPALFTGLDSGTQYTFYVRGICPTSGTSLWSTGFNFNTLIENDNCDGAIFAPVNSDAVCQLVTPGTITGATASVAPGIVAPCVGTPDDDVWFQFIATNAYLNVSLQSVVGSTTNLNFAVYSGQCGTLTQVFCSTNLAGVLNNLTVGATYYIRVFSNSATPQSANFNLCISTPSTCANSSSICSEDGLNYGNTTGVTSLGQIGCLFTSPNPTFFTIQVVTSGPINYLLTQSTTPGGTPNLDVDYAAWGPFSTQAQVCAAIAGGQAPLTGLTTGCSYSAAPTENFNIANAVAGQFYVILITNFSNQPGYITLTQTNFGTTSGATLCCPEADFAYSSSTYCIDPSVANPIPTLPQGSVAGVFSLLPNTPTGLVFANTATGEIDLQNSLPGNYVVVNTLAANGTCLEIQYTFTISLVLPAAATIVYGATSYCESDTTVYNVTQTGTTGGTYSALPNGGLFIDVNTGAINPSLSSPGVYTVSYSLPGSGVCIGANPSTQVEIAPLPSITQPADVQACNSYALPALSVGNYFDGPGGTGNQLSAGYLVTNTQTLYIYAVSNLGCINEVSFTVNIISVPTPTVNVTQTTCTVQTGTIEVTSPVSTGGLPSNLFISEITDATSGALTYIEIFNGTGAAVDLSNYKLRTFNNGSATVTSSCDNTLSGILNNNSTFVVAVGSATNQGGIVPNQVFALCTGVNVDDNIRLTTTANVDIDIWGRVDGTTFTPGGQPGYTYRRNTTAVAPSTTWNAADWTTTDPEDYTNIGSYATPASVYQYSLDNGAYQVSTTFNNVAPGTHTVTVLDLATGCSSLPLTVVINPVPFTPTVLGFSYTTPICQNAQATLSPVLDPGFTTNGQFTGTAGLVINGNTGVITLGANGSTPGNHTITYTVLPDNNICLAGGAFTFDIVINPIITPVTTIGYDALYCSDEDDPLPDTSAPGFTTGGTFTGTNGLLINASTGLVDLSSPAGTYTVTYSVGADSNTCRVPGSSTAQVVISSPIQIVATGNCEGVQFVLTASPVEGTFDSNVTFVWENSAGTVVGSTQSIVVTALDTYTVTVTSNGCPDSASLPVDAITCVIQKGISANNDGYNDYFDLRGFNVKKLSIFNRYGMKVYTKGNYTDQWKGQSDDGDELPDGTYYFVIERDNGENRTGWIYINRAQ
ncbi:choice-of-anchor J domain-containing protein [Flavobacterium sp. J49]|uniref:choice-of-anchor J domain-containing protein n=1 Tax=Flavobacterium sp. J49 TaxID=2718534 RepID=UPI001593479F|nr:choice-of-anchor J domain-containing protein [Flavobacterium sp. J49]MBF6641280.1 choice-of-anchor J domain-containing protein [Flavobacterium sp. J49]NIC02527.1 T9SS type B sorting domain-containing protein [Flavobacterium sp. J49]